MEKERKRLYLILVFILILAVILGLLFIIPLFETDSGQAGGEEAAALNPGWLAVEGADIRGHEIIDADSGEQVGLLSPAQSKAEVPPGVYHVNFGGAVWKDIQVKAGETTLLQPGVLSVNNASFRGHEVLDLESGEERGMITNLAGSLTLIPGRYRVMFGGIHWDVEIEAGQTQTLNPGVVTVEGASYMGHTIRTQEGKEVGSVSNTGSSMPLPPGEYTIEVGGEMQSFTIEEGRQVTFTEK